MGSLSIWQYVEGDEFSDLSSEERVDLLTMGLINLYIR